MAAVRARWLNYEDPRISHAPWSEEENARLVALVAKYDGYQWIEIAKELNTFRAPIQCFAQYQRECNATIGGAREWTADEDARLCQVRLLCCIHSSFFLLFSLSLSTCLCRALALSRHAWFIN